MNKEKFYTAMVKRFSGIPALTDYSSSAKNDIYLDEALNLFPDEDNELIKELEATNKKLTQEVKSLESALDLLLKRYEELGVEIKRQPTVEPSWNEPIAHVVDYITIPQQRLAIPRR